MQICMVIWKFYPCAEGGAERQCRRLAAELSRQGHRCEVLTSRLHPGLLPDETMPAGCRVVRLGRLAWLGEACAKRVRAALARLPLPAPLAEAAEFWLPMPCVRLARLSFLLALREFFKENLQRIEVVHVHEAHWIAGAAVWACQGTGLPVVCKEASFPFADAISRDAPRRRTLARLRRQADFIALTAPIAESLRQGGISGERITVVPNGVDLPEECSPVAGAKDVVYIGNLTQGSRWKAFDILFEAWAQVQEKDQGRSRLVVLGAGDPAVWQRYLDQHGCRDSVHFAGAVQEVGAYLRRARLFLLPSRVEGLSNALLEAMSWALPVIVSAIPANCSVVRHQVNGWIVPVNNSRALAEAALLLLADDALSLRLGQAARRSIEEAYTISRVAGQLTGLYAQLIERAGRVHRRSGMT